MGQINIVDYPRPCCCFSNLSLVSRGGGGGAQPPDSHQYFLSLGIVLFGRVSWGGYDEHVRSREVVLRMQCGLTECSMNVQQAWPGRKRSDIGVKSVNT